MRSDNIMKKEKKMKKIKGLIAFCLVVICFVFPLSACMTQGGNINSSKSQLIIGNYDGGFGHRWLDEYIAAFEAKYADVSFEENKKGVEVIPLNEKDLFDGNYLKTNIANSPANLIFTERLDYYYLVNNNQLYDISDIVTSDIEGEEKSIEDKLNDDQKSRYKVDGKYYGVPHYQTYRGIVYDVDLFNEKKLYIKESGDIAGRSTDTDLSAGPNGVKGDYDDGLPATYSEFFRWCNEVSGRVYPICWTGTYKQAYTEHLLDALYVDSQGYTEANYFYNLNLNKTQDATSMLVTGFNGDQPIVSSQVIKNRTDLLKQKGLYDALDFLYKIIAGNYYYPASLNISETHEMVHYHYLRSRFGEDSKPIALMIEGTWWEEESNDLFVQMVGSFGEDAARENRNFGFMPLPKPDGQAAGAPTLFDGTAAMAVVNGNCTPLQAELAKKFIQFISTDENLELFHTMVGIGRDYDYELSEKSYNSLSTYAKSAYDIKREAEGVVYGYPLDKDMYSWDQVNLLEKNKALVDVTVFNSPIDGFTDSNKKATAIQYFNGIYANALR